MIAGRFALNLFKKTLLVKLCTVVLLIAAVIVFAEMSDAYIAEILRHIYNPIGIAWIWVFGALLVFKFSFFGYLFVAFLRYKPAAPVCSSKLPTCTVIVPAYNEGILVLHTLQSIAKSQYPPEKIQIIAIDDGSRDDTWSWILKAKEELGSRLEVLQQPCNKGKRQALYRGFNLAGGDIIITIDSDSIVSPDTLRNLVSPFIADPKCGAVAGNVRVLNSSKALIPKMLDVSFAFGFEFVRSAQSKLGSVLCTPGALSAYRRGPAMQCLPQWICQKFLGKNADIGEDRAMTNMILSKGHKVLFQKNAVVYTNVPETYKGLYKMYIRWERSNVRENIMMSRFAFRNFRDESKFGSRVLLINQWMRVLLAIPVLLAMPVLFISSPLLYISVKLTAILIVGSIPACYFAVNYSKSDSLWGYCYGVFYAFSLFWIIPYAIVTVGRRGWLTRG
jgi:hyaluronan synthase